MSFVAFPVRFENGFLRRFDEPSALLSLIEIMARTPHGSWRGSVHFGLRDYFQGARGRPELTKMALEELNRALADLGIDKYRVESIIRETAVGEDSEVYAISLSSGGQPSQVFRIASRE
jgi:uncharacterized protein YjiS (DUF1127 family)